MSSDPIEIIIEPDVVPKGTVDVKSFDAPAGTPPPKVRVTRSGLVVPLGAPSRAHGLEKEKLAAALTPDVMSEVRDAVRSAIGDHLADGSAAAPVSAAEDAAREVRAAAAPVPEFDPVPEAPEAWEPPPGFELEPPPSADLASEIEATGTPDYAALDAAAQAPMPSRPESAVGELVGAGVSKSEPDYDPRFDTNIGGPGSIFDTVKVVGYLLVLAAGVIGLGLWITGTLPTSASTDVAKKTDETTFSVSPTDLTPSKPDVEKTVVAPEPTRTAEPEPTRTAEPEPTRTAEPEPEPTKTADPTPQPTKTPEPTPKPTATPKPDPKDELLALREMAKKTVTGVEVGVERDPLEQRISDLRARAGRALDAGDLAGAKKLLQELLKHDPDDAEGLLQLGYVHHQLGELPAAITHYQRSAAQAPSDPRPWNNLFLAHDARGERGEAKKSLKKALQLGPENPDVLTNLANFVSRRSPRRAHPLLDKALAQSPEHGPARLARGSVRERLGDTSGAQADYRLILKRKDRRYRPQALNGLGRLARRGGKHRAAISLHERALQSDATLHSARVGLGLALLESGDSGRATKVLEEATKRAPQSVAAWRALGVAYARQSETDSDMLVKSKQAYEQAIKLKPDDWQSRYNYAILAERAGYFPVAIMQYEKAIELEPKAWEPYMRLAHMYADTARGSKALNYLDRALKHRPDEPELHLYRARLLAGQDRRIEARSALRDYVRHAAPDDPRLDKIRKGLQ